MIVDDNKTSLQTYMHDISHTSPLSRADEALLAARIQGGDLEARNELVTANLRFVIDVAGKYKNRGLSFPELISAGNQGLLQAAERFDSGRGFKFITYAVWWIRQAISQTIDNHSRTIRLPINKVFLFKEIMVTKARLEREREGRVGIEDIAEELEVPVDTVRQTMIGERPLYSLDEILDDEGRSGIYEILADDRLPAPDEHLLMQDNRRQLERALARLDDRERRVIRLYFGLWQESPRTMESIGAEMKLTRERIRQIRNRALEKLRESPLCTMADDQ